MNKEQIDAVAKLSNNHLQDILYERGIIDEQGNCPYTAEEIFREGIEWSFDKVCEWLSCNVDLEHDYPSSLEELLTDLKQKIKL